MITSLPGLDVSLGLHGLDTYGRRRRVDAGEEYPCRIYQEGGSDGDSLRARSQRKNCCLRGRGGLASCPPLSGFGSVSSFQTIRTSQGGAASEHVGLN